MPASVLALPDYVAGTWNVDAVHSDVSFSVRHMMVSKVRGRFTEFDATIVTADDQQASSVIATIDLTSIDTGNEQRDNHIRSADFFEVEKYPTMTYRSSGLRPNGENWIVDGELTLHGVTRPVDPRARTQRIHGRSLRWQAGRILGHRRDQPSRLRRRHQHADGRWRRGRRRQDLDLAGDRGCARPSLTKPDLISTRSAPAARPCPPRAARPVGAPLYAQ